MTLIVPFLSDEFVALASDRRITWTIGGAAASWEDTENKAIVLHGQFLMGYTGFARLGSMKTEQWVLEKLHGVERSSCFTALASETETAVQALNQPLPRSGHAFAAVGYTPLREDASGRLHPVAVTVSNAIVDGRYGEWSPSPQFSVIATSLRAGQDFGMSAFGITPPRRKLDETIDDIRRHRELHPEKVLGVLQLMVELIRSVAASSEGVSGDVSVSVLPRVAVPATAVQSPLSSTGLRDPIEKLTCLFVPAGSDAQQAVVYNPALLQANLLTFGGEVWTTKPPWWRD